MRHYICDGCGVEMDRYDTREVDVVGKEFHLCGDCLEGQEWFR